MTTVPPLRRRTVHDLQELLRELGFLVTYREAGEIYRCVLPIIMDADEKGPAQHPRSTASVKR